LSAVDPKVAQAIFSDCIQKALAHKIVVLVTHQLQFLRESQRILVLKEGQQSCFGNFQEICECGFNIDEILKSYGTAEGKKEGQDFEAEAEAKEQSEKQKLKSEKGEASEEKEGDGDLIEAEKDEEQEVQLKDLFTYF